VIFPLGIAIAAGAAAFDNYARNYRLCIPDIPNYLKDTNREPERVPCTEAK